MYNQFLNYKECVFLKVELAIQKYLKKQPSKNRQIISCDRNQVAVTPCRCEIDDY